MGQNGWQAKTQPLNRVCDFKFQYSCQSKFRFCHVLWTAGGDSLGQLEI